MYFLVRTRRRSAPGRVARAALAGLFACALTLVVHHGLLPAGVPMTHEADAFVLRVLGLTRAIGQGQWGGRWIDSFAYGYGYPLFNFYAPGFYYPAALLHLAGVPLVPAIKLTIVCFGLAGILGAYHLGASLWRSRHSGVVVAVLFAFLPYRVLDLYGRGALGELAAINLIPWILLGHLAILRGTRTRASFLLAAVAHAALIWTHNILALLFQPFLLAYDVIFFFIEGERRSRSRLPRAGAAHLAALALSAGFWLPALAEMQHVHIEEVAPPGSEFDVRTQLAGAPRSGAVIDWGHGGEMPGPLDGMVFYLSIVGLLATVGAFWFLAHDRGEKRQDLCRLLALVLMGSVMVFLMLRVSVIVWDLIPLLRFVQFPWRLLSLASMCVVLAAGAVPIAVENRSTRVRTGLVCVIGVGAFASVWPFLRPAPQMPWNEGQLRRVIGHRYVTATVNNEYLPRAVPHAGLELPLEPGGAVLVTSGEGTIAARGKSSEPAQAGVLQPAGIPYTAGHPLDVTASSPVTVLWRHYRFPGWQARIDGKLAALNDESGGLISVDVPAGRHQLAFVFRDTPVRAAAETISAATALGLLIAFLLRARPRRTSVLSSDHCRARNH